MRDFCSASICASRCCAGLSARQSKPKLTRQTSPGRDAAGGTAWIAAAATSRDCISEDTVNGQSSSCAGSAAGAMPESSGPGAGAVMATVAVAI